MFLSLDSYECTYHLINSGIYSGYERHDQLCSTTLDYIYNTEQGMDMANIVIVDVYVYINKNVSFTIYILILVPPESPYTVYTNLTFATDRRDVG